MSRAAISKATDVTEHPARKRLALRHGLHSPRLAKGLAYADRQAGIFRRCLEDTLLARDGEITLHRAALVHTAVEAVKVASANRVEKRNATDAGKLTLELSIAFDREYLRALDLRDRKLEALGLDIVDPMASLLAEFNKSATEPDRADALSVRDQ